MAQEKLVEVDGTTTWSNQAITKCLHEAGEMDECQKHIEWEVLWCDTDFWKHVMGKQGNQGAVNIRYTCAVYKYFTKEDFTCWFSFSHGENTKIAKH